MSHKKHIFRICFLSRVIARDLMPDRNDANSSRSKRFRMMSHGRNAGNSMLARKFRPCKNTGKHHTEKDCVIPLR